MEDMSLAVNGQSRVPPGFRFHPTEEELLHYYLRKKVAYEKIDLDVIREVDLNKLEPWDIQEKCRIGSTPQNDWYFFSHKDKKYPTGTRTNRATTAGFWKATGRDKVIYTSFRRIGMRKTLVFYQGRAPHGQKSDWIMHEYRLDDQNENNSQSSESISVAESCQEDGWVICRVFKKKNYHKAVESPKNLATSGKSHAQMARSTGEGALDQILQCMGRMCKPQNESSSSFSGLISRSNYSSFSRYSSRPIDANVEAGTHSESFMPLPGLDSPIISAPSGGSQNCYTSGTFAPFAAEGGGTIAGLNPDEAASGNWAVLDSLLSSQFQGQEDSCKQLATCINDTDPIGFCPAQDQDLPLLPYLRSRSFVSSQDYSSGGDLCIFGRTSSF